MLNTFDKAVLIAQVADNAKGQDICIYDVQDLSSITGSFVIITGTTQNHLKAIGAQIEKYIRSEAGEKPLRIDGATSASWRVYDYGDVIVHIMVDDSRQFYAIERLWGDAREIQWSPKSFSI